MITGEHWRYKSPTFYTFRYFRFIPASGGFGPDYANLDFSFSIENYEDLIQNIEKIREEYPYSCITLRKGRPQTSQIFLSSTIEISISGPHTMLFDYDMNLVTDIESYLYLLEEENQLGPPISNVIWQSWVHLGPLVKFEYIKFDEKGIDWVYTSPDKASGSERCLLRIDMHSKAGLNDKVFFNELRKIVDQCNIDYLDYRALSNNYMIFLGNGRLGIRGIPYTLSDWEYFKQRILVLAEKYRIILGHEKDFFSSGYYSALVESTVKVVKDERR